MMLIKFLWLRLMKLMQIKLIIFFVVDVDDVCDVDEVDIDDVRGCMWCRCRLVDDVGYAKDIEEMHEMR